MDDIKITDLSGYEWDLEEKGVAHVFPGDISRADEPYLNTETMNLCELFDKFITSSEVIVKAKNGKILIECIK